MANTQNILVIGGGFGGVKAAQELAKTKKFAVTLISDRSDFWYFPSLYHTATGATNKTSSIPLKRLFAGKPIKLIIGKAISLDRASKHVELEDKTKISYDKLIISLGMVTNYFGIKGLEEFSYGIKSIKEADELKTHIHKQLDYERDSTLHYVIVGGGATGIELAGQLPSYLKKIMKKHGIHDRKIHIDLVEGSPHLMPRMPRTVGKHIEKQLRKLGIRLYLGKHVNGETADALLVNNKPIRSHTVIWTAGQANNRFFSDNKFVLNERHKVVVNNLLETEPDIYVIGDNADTQYSGMAQTAVYDAEFVAQNLIWEASGRPIVAYRPKKPIYVMPAGAHWAAVEWGKLHIYGWLGWLLRETADIKGFLELEEPIAAGEQWLQEFTPDNNCTTCGDID